MLAAFEAGYRGVDTAFVYGNEKVEPQVGLALRDALRQGVVASREDVVITTKHWRKYHGYDESLRCLGLSLRRLGTDYVDLWLMHWPGPAWTTMNRKKEVVTKDRWAYARAGHGEAEIASLRAETWRAMEEALRQGKVRAWQYCGTACVGTRPNIWPYFWQLMLQSPTQPRQSWILIFFIFELTFFPKPWRQCFSCRRGPSA